MPEHRLAALNEPQVRAALRQAWHDSQSRAVGGHEEGGFLLRDTAGNWKAMRWPRGGQNDIVLPPHPNCKIGNDDIVLTFHTHPNTGNDYLQEPSETDKRAVRDDPDLKGAFYEGEFVISQNTIYLIDPNGQVSEAGNSQRVFDET